MYSTFSLYDKEYDSESSVSTLIVKYHTVRDFWMKKSSGFTSYIFESKLITLNLPCLCVYVMCKVLAEDLLI